MQFVWRLVDDDGLSWSYVRLPGRTTPLGIVNMSVWADLESRPHFMYESGQLTYLRRRIEWFECSPTSSGWPVNSPAQPEE